MCTETQTCSVMQSCDRDTVLLLAGLGGSRADPMAVPSSEPVYGTAADMVFDSKAPVISLLPVSATRFVSTDGIMTGVLTVLTVGDAFTDPGYVASDDSDVSIQSKVVARGQEVINMGSPTPEGAPYTISYNVIDFSGGDRGWGLGTVRVDCKDCGLEGGRRCIRQPSPCQHQDVH